MLTRTAEKVLKSCSSTEDDSSTGSESDGDKMAFVKDDVGSLVKVDTGLDIATT